MDNYSDEIMDFAYFSNRQQFIDVATEANQYVNDEAQKRRSTRTARFDLDDVNNWNDLRDYEYRDALNRYLDDFENWIAKIDMGGAFKKQRLIITGDNRGVFSFGVASKGLYKPSEFFSDSLAIESPDEFSYLDKPSGIVPALYVTKREIFNTVMYFYTSKNGKEYNLTKQDEGTRAIELALPDAKKVFKTTAKKAYVMFPKKGGKAKMIDLYIPKNAGISLTNILPSLMIAYFMRLYGVMCRISVIRVWHLYGTEITTGESKTGYGGYGFMVKDFGDDLDFNNIALQACDGRTWDSVVQSAGNIMDSRRYGKTVNNLNIESTDNTGGVPSYMDEFMGRYRNFYMGLIKEGKIDPIRIDKKLMVMGFVDSTNRRNIMSAFWRVLDLIDFQFNKTDEVLSRIYNRYVVEEGKSQTVFKEYIIGILQSTYDYPTGGMYAESVEDSEKMDAEYSDKLQELTNFMDGLV